MNNQGPVVVNLQDGLRRILASQKLDLPPDEANQLLQLLARESQQQTYGDGTFKVVEIFQERRQLPVTGQVDDATATALNQMLNDLGGFDQDGNGGTTQVVEALKEQSAVLRTISDGTGRLPDIDAKIPDATTVSAIREGTDHLPLITQGIAGIAQAQTVLGPGARGDAVAALHADLTRAGYQLPQDERDAAVFGVGTRDAVLQVQQRASVAPTGSVDSVTRTALDVAVSAASNANRIEGRILLDNGLPAAGVQLRAVNKGFGDQETELGRTQTDAQGFYALQYEAGGGVHNLQLHAVASDDTRVQLSEAKGDVPRNAVVNLVAPSSLGQQDSEFARLAHDLTPHIGGDLTNLAGAQENPDRQDLSTLTRTTGWDARVIGLAATAAQLHTAIDGQLSHDGLYGLLRAGLPSDALQLAQLDPAVITQALTTVRDAGVIGLTNDDITSFTQRFQTFANTTLLSRPAPGSTSTFADLLSVSGLPSQAQEAFAPVYLHHRGDADRLWHDARDAGLDEQQVSTLQLQGKLAFLSGNSAAMTARLSSKQITDPADLVDSDLHDPEQWKAEATALADGDEQKLASVIPAAYEGDSVQDRLEAYAQDMARKVRLSYPTHVLGRVLEQDDADAFALGELRSPTATVLKAAARQGYRLGQTPPTTFFEGNPGAGGGLGDDAFRAAVDEVKKLHRAYQITPNNTAMASLLTLGLHSAYDVVAVPEQRFVDLYGSAFATLDEARLVHRKATQVSEVTYNLFAAAKALGNAPVVHGLSPAPEVLAQARRSLIKHFPTMESLFGSMDYCECEHCRSVLSPAAYLVDLLQFVDIEAPVWANFLSRWKEGHAGQEYTGAYLKPYDALVERRPDLAHIELTCENTNTELPYIDLVNEILEYYVAHDALTAAAVNDTGDASSDDLVAEPQNLIPEAYDRLLTARYPLTLPFDLWLETVRRFCTSFGTSLATVLEVFRPGDELFVPTQPYDRAAVFTESLGISPVQAAIFTDPAPVADDAWYALYGLSAVRSAIEHPTNASPASVSIADADAIAFAVGDPCTYVDVSAGSTHDETRVIADVGAPGSAGPGLTTITFQDVWTTPPDVGDLLVIDGPTALRSAKTLARRLGVTYEDIVRLVQAGFVNPALPSLVVLYKLGVSVQDARFAQEHADFYAHNQDLLAKDPATLSAADRQRYDALLRTDPHTGRSGWQDLQEVRAFQTRLTDLSATYGVPVEQLRTAVQAVPFDQVLLLADPEAGCDFDLTTLRRADGTEADADDLLRLNLLVRLWHILGWPLDETDQALTALLPANAPFRPEHYADRPLRTALVSLGHLDALATRLGTGSRLSLLPLWGDIPTGGAQPLYAQLFLSPGMLRLDDVFDHPLGQYLSPEWIKTQTESRTHWVEREHVLPADRLDPAVFTAADPRLQLRYDDLEQVQHLGYQGTLSDAAKTALLALSPSQVLGSLLDAVQTKAAEFGLLKGHLPALEGALGLTADEIGTALDAAKLSLNSAELSLPHVSLLYRHRVLARGLGLSVEELITLIELSGIDPFTALGPAPFATLADDHPFSQTLRFVDTAETVAASGLSVEDLDYLLRHRYDPTGAYRARPEQTLALLATLAEGVQAIRSAHAVPDDPGSMTEEEFRQQLGLVLPPAVSERFQALLSGTAQFTAAASGIDPAARLDRAQFAGEQSISDLSWDPTTQTQTLTVRGVLFDERKARLRDAYAPPLLTSAQQATLATLLDLVQAAADQEAQAFFTKYLERKPIVDTSSSGFLDQADFALVFDPVFPQDPDAAGRLHQRQATLARSILPFLQERLIRQFLVSSLTTDTGAEPALVHSLLTDERLLALPEPAGGRRRLLDVVEAVAQRGVTVTLAPQNTTTTLPDADLGLLGNAGQQTASAQLEGYLQVPAPGIYRFYVQLGKQGATAQLRFADLPAATLVGTAATDGDEIGAATAAYAELKAGILYRFTLSLGNLGGGTARLLVQGETLPKDPLGQLVLYPAAPIEAAERALLLLAKAVQLLGAAGIGDAEARHLLTHADDFDGLDLSTLPTQAPRDEHAGAASAFRWWLRLAGYGSLKRDLAGRTDDLIGVFQAADDLDAVYPRLATLTRRQESTVRATANALFPAPDFSDERSLRRLWEALQMVTTLGVPVAAVRDVTRIVSPALSPEQRFAVARGLEDALHARFDADSWRGVAQPVFDSLRARRRDALVQFIMQRHGFTQLEQLYEFFLVDPGMEPVVRTSRIRLAIASVQLFVQRCLLNLESRVPPAAIINASQWEWMRRYRVWEANRKIFLFPENFLEPEFRDDKTSLFTELEGSLLQGDVSEDLVQDAFLTYLNKLEQIARLDVVGMHLEDKDDPAQNVLHVIGRTHGSPHVYFYRRYAHDMWTAWEPVTAQIEGDHLLPIVWHGRLHLFWVTFTERGIPPDVSVTVDFKSSVTVPKAVPVMREYQAHLHWSAYTAGTWSTGESAEHDPPPTGRMTVQGADLDARSVFAYVSKEAPQNGEDAGVFVNIGQPFNSAFYLPSRNSQPTVRRQGGPAPANPYNAQSIAATGYLGTDTFQVTFNQRISTEQGSPPQTESPDILKQAGPYSLLPTDNASLSTLGDIGPLIRPVFFQDGTNTLFVEPSLTERTVEEWQEWVTRIPLPESAWAAASYWKHFPVAAVVSRLEPVPVVDQPWRFNVDATARFTLRPAQDWLTDPRTTVLYGDQVIGPQGRTGSRLETADLSTGVLDRDLTVVGSGGLSPALRQHLTSRSTP